MTWKCLVSPGPKWLDYWSWGVNSGICCQGKEKWDKRWMCSYLAGMRQWRLMQGCPKSPALHAPALEVSRRWWCVVGWNRGWRVTHLPHDTQIHAGRHSRCISESCVGWNTPGSSAGHSSHLGDTGGPPRIPPISLCPRDAPGSVSRKI